MSEMSAEQLKQMRGDRSAQEFGQFVAELMGKDRPYTAQEIWNWENGLRPVPARVATVLLLNERKNWLIVPYGDEFLCRMACPICGCRNPVQKETGRAMIVEFRCGAAERLANGERKTIGVCEKRRR